MLSLTIWLLPVAIFVAFAVRYRSSKQQEIDSVSNAIEIHKERLANLQAQHEQGQLGDEEYQSFKAEEQKALLADSEHNQQQQQQNTQLSWLWVPSLTIVVFALAWLVYAQVGASDAVKVRDQFDQLAASPDIQPEQIETTLAAYQQLLLKQPDDIEGWFRLSRMQMEMAQFEGALTSLQHVLKQLRLVEHQSEDEAAILSYMGQSYMALGQQQQALSAFEESLQYEQNSTALGLAGKMSFDLGDYQKAIDYWTRLKLANPNSDAGIVDQFIDQAKEQLAAQGIDYDEVAPTRIIVNLNLPAAYEGLPPEAALFVYARPIGQRMPLAVKRLPVNAQSMTVMLSDADAMGPMGGISGQTEVDVTARVSLTGIANAQAGDWPGDVVAVSLTEKETTVDIVIDLP